jgi:hypothetical protein
VTKPTELVDTQADSSLFKLSGWGQRNSLLRGLLLVVLTLLVFYLLFRRIDLSLVIALLRTIPAGTWSVATLLTLSFPVMSAVRWHLILRTMGFDVSTARCLLIIVGIWPLSSVSPSKAGDLLKAVSLRHKIGPVVVAGSVLTERALDLLMLAAFALIGGLFFRDLRITAVAAVVMLGVIAAVMVAWLDIELPVGQKLQGKLKELLHSIRVLGTQPITLIAILVLTVANWLASIVQTKLLFDGVGASVPLGFTAAALPVAIFVGLLPITFGGMGTRDSAMVVLFAAFATASQALAVGLLYSFFGYWLLAIVGIPFVKKALDW